MEESRWQEAVVMAIAAVDSTAGQLFVAVAALHLKSSSIRCRLSKAFAAMFM
jgi:hypothetical protein